MKLFEHTQQTTHSKADLEKLKAVALETLRESSRYVETYNDTTTALGLLKRLEVQGGSNSPVTQLAYESINDQLGYEEGTRLSAETIGEAIIGFGKRMWEKVLAAWDAVSAWSSGIMDRFKSESNGKAGGKKLVLLDSEFTKEELVKRFVVDPEKGDAAFASFDPFMKEESDFLDRMQDFISNSTNLKDTDDLLLHLGSVTNTFILSQQIPLQLEELYRNNNHGSYIEEQIIDALEGKIEPVEVVTLKKRFTFSKDEVHVVDEVDRNARMRWVFKDSIGEIDTIVHMYNVQIGIVEGLKETDKFTDKVAPMVAQVINDKKVITELIQIVTECRTRLFTLRKIAEVAIGKSK